MSFCRKKTEWEPVSGVLLENDNEIMEVKTSLKTAGLAGNCSIYKQIASAFSAFFAFFLVASITNYTIQFPNIRIH